MEIFDKKCDLIIIPCNTHGEITVANEIELKKNNYIYHPVGMVPATVWDRSCPSDCHISSMVGFAASVDELAIRNSGVTKKYLRNICDQIKILCAKYSLYTVNIPLLGTGVGGLLPQESMEVFKQYFGTEKNFHINIFVLSKNNYQLLSDKDKFDYDVALSFAGEDRAYVNVIANELKSKGIKVFYDKFETSNLWGKDLYQYLNHIYKDNARYCVIFVSDNYKNKAWTKHELKSAQNRAFVENKEYILPIFLEDIKLDGLNDTIGYIKASEFSESEIVDLIIEKIQ